MGLLAPRAALVIGTLAALASVSATAAQAKTRTVTCQGGADRCVATVALAGLKTGDRVVINLSDTDLQLRAITPSKPSVQAAYGFAGLSMREGGSQFVARMLIDPPVPARARVSFAFAVPPRMTSCGDATFTIDGASIRLTDVQARGLTCSSARRVAQNCVSGVGPGRGWSVLQVDDLVILQRDRQRVTFGEGSARSTCAPSG